MKSVFCWEYINITNSVFDYYISQSTPKALTLLINTRIKRQWIYTCSFL